MWICKNCKEEHEDNFDSCWNCSKKSDRGLIDSLKTLIYDDPQRTRERTPEEEKEVQRSIDELKRKGKKDMNNPKTD